MVSRALHEPAVGGRNGSGMNSASDSDNDSEKDDCCTASDSTAWRDHTDSIRWVH